MNTMSTFQFLVQPSHEFVKNQCL